MDLLRLDPRENLNIPSRLFPQATATAGTAPMASLPLPAPNKLDITETLDLKFFNVKDIQSLTKIVDIQRWHNGLHSKGRVCGIYTSHWESVVSAGIFKGECEEFGFGHMVSNSKGNGYL
jgi:hypothetical protein